MLTDFEIGFVVGLIVGEGSFTGDRTQPALSIKLHQDDRATLEFSQRLLGGVLYGPYFHGGRHYSILLIRGKPLKALINLFQTYLTIGKKRTQFELWRNRWGI